MSKMVRRPSLLGRRTLDCRREAPTATPRRRSLLGRRTLGGSQPIAFLYLLPAFAFFVAFAVIPLGQSVFISFFEWNGITDRHFIGFENYLTVLTEPKIREALQHSLVLILFYAVLPISIALVIVGLLVRVRIRGQAFYRSVLFMPTILPLTVVAVAWRWIYAPGRTAQQST